MIRLVDVLVQQRTAAVDRPLSYHVPDGMELAVGDVVRVPLGPREVYGFVIETGSHAAAANLRPVGARVEGPRAFDAAGLRLAHWIAEHYCCTLGEALAPMIYGAALPRAIDRFALAPDFAAARLPCVPPRLTRLIWDDLREGFTLDALLRHPEARRAGDRRALLRALSALVRSGALLRSRTFAAARMSEVREKFLEPGEREVRGPRVRALVEFVRAEGTLRRGDALLAGFSQGVIARALREGGLRETSERAARRRSALVPQEQGFVATGEQQAAIDAIVARVEAGTFAELLLQGVTGSGKTLVYIRAIARTLALGGRAIVLVPEIALTPQTARRFEGAFGERVAVLHSGLSERERFDGWHAAARGEVDVVVGARSAVFAPLPDVRLIVVDEAHERSTNRTACRAITPSTSRANGCGAPAASWCSAARRRRSRATRAALGGAVSHLRLARRASEQELPRTQIVDMAAEFERGNRRIFSSALVDGIGLRLERREKVVLFVNRRGSAGFMLCRNCGAVPECARCSLSLTVHRGEGLLRCHYCDAQRPIPQLCPACGQGPIREFGVGTQKVAEEALALFPRARIMRMDADTTTRVGDHARLLDDFEARGDMLVGTQMVAKGLDFPQVTLVGVVAADIGLHLPDFRAAERSFDLLAQVAAAADAPYRARRSCKRIRRIIPRCASRRVTISTALRPTSSSSAANSATRRSRR